MNNIKTPAKEVKERPKILTTLKFNSLKKHETLSKNFAINNKRKDTSDFNRGNFELLQIDWSMPYDVKLPTPITVIRQFFNPTILCSAENTLVRWIHRIHRTI